MKKFSYAGIIILIILMNVSFSYAKIPEIILKQKRAVVTVYINDKDGKQITTGTGFIINSNGTIVTNFHVISKWFEKDNTLLVKMENGAYFTLHELVNFDEENDIAIFKVDGKELPMVKLAKNYKPKQGESIVVVGSPLGLETTLSDGIISSVREKGGVIQITAPISPGSSGSPVFNSKGEVIGVATFLIEGGQNLNFAIPVKHIENVLKDAAKPKKKIGNSESPPTPATVDEPPKINISKADTLFAEQKYNEAMDDYVSIYWTLFKADKNHPKLPYIALQIAKAFLLDEKDMLSWNWFKFLNKHHPNSLEAFLAKDVISNKRWFFIGDSTTDSKWYIDVTSITPIDQNNIRANVQVVGRKGKNVTNNIYDCALGRSAILGAILYNSAGKAINSIDASNNLRWDSVAPNSIGEAVWKVVCDKQ